MFQGGYTGKYLRIDLSQRKVMVEKLDEGIARKYCGGRGWGGYLLLKELGLAGKAVLISHVGHRNEKIIYDLTSLKDKRIGYLSVILVRRGL